MTCLKTLTLRLGMSVCEKFVYFLLQVQRWASDKWQIHGLWPQFNSSSYPSYCEQVEYQNPYGALEEKMNDTWYSGDNSSGLWEHEWEKHGSCTKQQLDWTEFTFFNNTVNLFEGNKPLLENCGSGKNCTMGCFDLNGDYMECPDQS